MSIDDGTLVARQLVLAPLCAHAQSLGSPKVLLTKSNRSVTMKGSS